jgi:predicted PurR-regulated permease PerM
VAARTHKIDADRDHNAISFLLIVLTVGLLYWAKPVVVPLALSILLAFVLSPLVSALHRQGLSRVPSVLIVSGAALVALCICGWFLTSQLVQFVDQLPTYQDNVAKRISELRQPGSHSLVRKLSGFVEKVSVAATEPLDPQAEANVRHAQPVKVVNRESSWPVAPLISSAGQLFEFLAYAGLVIVLVIYLLISREDIRNRVLRLVGEGRITVTTKAIDEAAQSLSRYLLAQLTVNASFGLFIGCGLWLLGLPYAVLWGVCAGFLRYVPFVGPWLAALLPLSLSLVTANGWLQPLTIIALFVVFELLANLVAEPLLYGQSMGVSPVALLVAIAFWAWLWGGMGLVLAVPLTVCLVVLGKHVARFKFLDILLSDEPALTAEAHFYQRLLARDQDEASDLVHERLGEMPLDQLADEVLIPCLVFARRDYEAGLISAPELESIVAMVGEIAEELGPLPVAEAGAEEGSKLKILACAARDHADEAALELFQRLIELKGCTIQTVAPDRLVSEIIAIVADERPSIVCIASLPPGGLAHTRLLCLRLRSRFPKLKIVVGRWALRSQVEKNRSQLIAAGADHFGVTLRETSTQLLALGQFIKSAADTEHPVSPAVPAAALPG